MADFDPTVAPVPVCEDPSQTEGPPHLFRCHRYPWPLTATNFFPFRRPGEFLAPPPADYSRWGATPGFGPGMFIPHYLLDWGDCVKRIHRKRCHPTILKSFPRHQDRALALFLTHKFTWKNDDHDPPFTAFLIKAPPFAGYTWDAAILLEWLALAEGAAIGQGQPMTLTKEQSLIAAAHWIERVQDDWESATRELFPYTVADIFRFWVKPEVAAPVP